MLQKEQTEKEKIIGGGVFRQPAPAPQTVWNNLAGCQNYGFLSTKLFTLICVL